MISEDDYESLVETAELASISGFKKSILPNKQTSKRSRQSCKKKLKSILLNIICEAPQCGKKLLGDLDGNYSYRLDLKNRIVYSFNKKKKIIYIKRARTHYGD